MNEIESGFELAHVVFREARASDAPAMAELLHEHMPWSRIRGLGIAFLTLIHHALCTSTLAVCRVAESDGELVGYCAGVLSTAAFTRQFKWKYGWRAALILLPQLMKKATRQVIKKGLTYHDDVAAGDPAAEMSAFAILPKVTGTGLGRRLFDDTMEKMRARGADGVRLGTVDVNNHRAIAFYEKCGFEIARTIPFYEDTSVHVYIKRFEG